MFQTTNQHENWCVLFFMTMVTICYYMINGDSYPNGDFNVIHIYLQQIIQGLVNVLIFQTSPKYYNYKHIYIYVYIVSKK